MHPESWGRYPRQRAGTVVNLAWRSEALPAPAPFTSMLAYGCGRSYGDSCLNTDQVLLRTRGLNRFIAFNSATGTLRAEAGVTLAEILALIVPQGWFLPVTPGTRFISLGGAVANDVHGKNQVHGGNFGHHVRALELLTSDGQRRECSPTQHRELFAATVGGMGLTGLITWVEIALRRIQSPYIAAENVRFANLEEFFAVSAESEPDYDYTVAWVDAFAAGDKLGRGIFTRGNHAAPLWLEPSRPYAPRPITLPVTLPTFALNSLSLGMASTLLYYRQRPRQVAMRMHYEPFFYPLDGISHWNRAYGKRGFLQHQCVLPTATAHAALTEILTRVANSRRSSFLAVLKSFGPRPGVGLMSFPRPGVTLALDFPAHPEVFTLLDTLDDIVVAAGGAIYPAKDARMQPRTFAASFAHIEAFARHRDPAFSSTFWRRVTASCATS